MLTPPVKIHAPVVTAALIRPFPKTCLSLGCRSKFWRPPWTDISSVGNSSCHSFTMRCSKLSGLVSYDTRIYCKRYWIIRLVPDLTVVLELNMFITSLRELCLHGTLLTFIGLFRNLKRELTETFLSSFAYMWLSNKIRVCIKKLGSITI